MSTISTPTTELSQPLVSYVVNEEFIPQIEGAWPNFKIHTRYGAAISMNVNPTDDCQTFSVGEIRGLFHEPMDNSDKLRFIKILQHQAQKKQMLFNIQTHYEKSVDAFIAKNRVRVIFKHQYTSTRGSEMIFYLVDLTKTFYLQ